MPRRRLLIALGAVAVVAALVIGAIQAGSKSQTPAKATLTLSEQQARLAGAPAPLAALHAQASQLLDGGTTAVKQRMAALHGYPMVINKWGSWCGPCRLEFPVFQRVSVSLGKRVAFLGIDGTDPPGDARKFLAQIPLSYPSYRDPHEKISSSLDAGKFYPTTVFVDARGHRTVHQGGYTSEATLEQDIRRYALDA